MFKKVLLAEDFDSINIGIKHALNDLGIAAPDHAKYCDDAYLKIRKALQDGEPYDLLISDLSFKEDHRQTTITDGDELIQKVRQLQPNIVIIGYSVEDKSYRIKQLFEKSGITSFVLKGRNSIDELKKVITITANNSSETYISPEIAAIIQEKNSYEIDDIDIEILKHLSHGTAQDDITETFKNSGIKPNSKSTIEKRIAKLKDFFKANTTIHLISITKDMGII